MRLVLYVQTPVVTVGRVEAWRIIANPGRSNVGLDYQPHAANRINVFKRKHSRIPRVYGQAVASVKMPALLLGSLVIDPL